MFNLKKKGGKTMGIKLNVVQDKRKQSNNLWYGKALMMQTLDTHWLAQRIEQSVSVKESDVYAVLIELANVMNYELSQSNKISLDRFGYFYIGAKTTGALTKDDFSVAENVKGFRINFVPFNKRDTTGKVISKSFAWGLTAEKYAVEGQIIVPKKKEEPEP